MRALVAPKKPILCRAYYFYHTQQVIALRFHSSWRKNVMLHEVLCLFCQPPKRGAADAEPSGSRALIAVFLVQNKLHNIFFDGVERLVQIERCLVRA